MTEIFRALRLNEREECINLWQSVWPGENSRAYFERYFYGDVEWLPYYTQVTECDSRLVSAVHVCKRSVSCGDYTLTMGGVANVATLPEYRGRGYNSRCLKNAIEVMEADAMDFSLLFTDINTYYRRFGFSDIPRQRTIAFIKSDYQPLPSKYSVRRAVSADMPAIRRVYESFNHDRPITVRRSEAYWRDWMGFDPDNPPAELSVAVTEAGDLAGYVYLGVFNSAVPYGSDDAEARIIELCTEHASEDDESKITGALLSSIICSLPRSEPRKLIMEIAATPAVSRVVAEMARMNGIERVEINSAMVRLLHRDNLINNVALCSYERWQNEGSPSGELVFDTPYGISRIEGPQQRRAVLGASGSEAVEPISQSNLFGLMFGSVAPQQATGDAPSYPLLSALFPCREMVYWGVDGF